MRRKKASEKEKGRVRKERKKDSENEHAAAADGPAHRELKDRIYLSEFNHREVERRAVAIRAIRDAQIERILTQLRMARSIFSEEQLNMPLVEFLKKYCPNTEAVRNSDGVMEMRMKGHVLDAGGAYNEAREFRDSIGCQASVGCGASDNINGQAFAMPTPTCFPFMDAAAQGWSAMNATQLKDEFLRNIGMYNNQSAVFEGNSEIKVADRESSILTPQTELKMQSVIGVTPKSQRLPRRGEMLMSIHGSPLGFYAEDKMDTICESEKEL